MPWNSSDSPEGEGGNSCGARCRYSEFLWALVRVTAVCLCLFVVPVNGNVVTVLLIGRYRDV